MAGPATALRQINRSAPHLDRSAGRLSAGNDRDLSRLCPIVDRVGTLLSQPAAATTLSEAELMLPQVWCQLSPADQASFGECFSRMILKAIPTVFPITQEMRS